MFGAQCSFARKDLIASLVSLLNFLVHFCGGIVLFVL
ncbi:hypothetical protein T12_9878 [Trichinella patagoniensis]|uniref:Uncharacterized protein n=1 Tax=Trichinella patagoniensis TaxID=990121 RepID=A0A0V0XDL5_9BILA|nr:hypothetical protein T12_9878 [Trichinella patagoniensis]